MKKITLLLVALAFILPSCRTRKYGCGLTSSKEQTIDVPVDTLVLYMNGKMNQDGLSKFKVIRAKNQNPNYIDTNGILVINRY